MLLLGDSIIRGIQQRKFAPNRYVNKQIIAGGTREIRQFINHMQERNDYDYIVIHSGINDVGKLTANEIRTNMESCIVNLKHRWPNSTIAISGVTYVPRDNSKNQLIDEINSKYESICTDLDVTFIDDKRVTCDNYGNLIEQVFYDDVHLNNKIGTKKLVTDEHQTSPRTSGKKPGKLAKESTRFGPRPSRSSERTALQRTPKKNLSQ